MKVNNVNAAHTDSLRAMDTDASAHDVRAMVFARKLSQESSSAYITRIEGLIEKIDRQGESLSKKADMGELQRYRTMITELVNETVSNGFAFEKSMHFGANGRAKTFATIKQINEKLDAMTQKLLSEQKENISLLNDVDDIRGLLVDMFL